VGTNATVVPIPGPWHLDEVEDPCVGPGCPPIAQEDWTIITCSAKRVRAVAATEWECGGYPEIASRACKPCEGLIPEDW